MMNAYIPINNPYKLPDISQFHFKTDIFDAMPINKVTDFVLPAPIVIDGLLHREHKMLLYGPVKAGKSYLVADLAISVACGRKWLGHKCEMGNVFICDIENGAAETQKRIEQICEQREISRECLNRITVTHIKGYTEITDFVNNMIENVPSGYYSVIIIDSVYNFMNGRESQAEDADYFMKEMDRLASALQAAVILCHHTKKATESYTSAIDKASGSTIFVRQAQTLVCISNVFEHRDCKKEHIKFIARHFPPQPSINVVFKDGIFSIVPEKEKYSAIKDTSFKKPITAKEQKAQNLIKAYEEIKSDDGTAKISDLASTLNVVRNTVKSYMKQTPGFVLVGKGRVKYSPPTE